MTELLLGAALAIIAGILVNLATERRKEINSDIENVISTSKHLANLATEYWSMDDSDACQVKEAKIISVDLELASKIERYQGFHPRFDDQIKNYRDRLTTECTSGDFQVRGRTADIGRSKKIYRTSALLNQELLRARDELCPRRFLWIFF